MTFNKARAIIHQIAHSNLGAWVDTADHERRASATMLLALEERVKRLEAKDQDPPAMKPLSDKLGDV